MQSTAAIELWSYGAMHIHNIYDESTKVQNPRRNSFAVKLWSCVYTAHARTSASLPRVGLRLYLACFTPVAPVASL